MFTCHTERLVRLAICLPCLWTFGILAEAHENGELHYCYVSLQDKVPPGFLFFNPAAINDDGTVSGTLYNCDEVACEPNVAIYDHDAVTVLQPGFAGPINDRGTVGGRIVLDPVTFATQAALFKRKTVTPIPAQVGEATSLVTDLNDGDTALVSSVDADHNESHILYRNGRSSVLDFGPDVTNPAFLHINNRGMLSGTTGDLSADARGFRLDPRAGTAILLEPYPGDLTEKLAWGVGINNAGDVLGYSFVSEPPYHERIGIWDHNGRFNTYFVQTTVSNRLLFNDDNLIIVTSVLNPPSEQGNSYIVPRPGKRLNLLDLVINLPAGQTAADISDLNNHGDMVGTGALGAFVLKRVNSAKSCYDQASHGDDRLHDAGIARAASAQVMALPSFTALRRDVLPPKDGSPPKVWQ